MGSPGKWKDRDTAKAAQIAKDKGGDALLIRAGEEMSGATSPGADPHLFSAGETGGLVIKWKSEIEVRESAIRLEGFRAYLKRSYPRLGLDSNEALWEMVTEYVTWLGLELDSDPGNAALENALASLNAPAVNSDSAKWLFKAALRSDTTAGETTGEQAIYGIATTSLSGRPRDHRFHPVRDGSPVQRCCQREYSERRNPHRHGAKRFRWEGRRRIWLWQDSPELPGTNRQRPCPRDGPLFALTESTGAKSHSRNRPRNPSAPPTPGRCRCRRNSGLQARYFCR